MELGWMESCLFFSLPSSFSSFHLLCPRRNFGKMYRNCSGVFLLFHLFCFGFGLLVLWHGEWTQGLMYARQVLHPWVMPPSPFPYESATLNLWGAQMSVAQAVQCLVLRDPTVQSEKDTHKLSLILPGCQSSKNGILVVEGKGLYVLSCEAGILRKIIFLASFTGEVLKENYSYNPKEWMLNAGSTILKQKISCGKCLYKQPSVGPEARWQRTCTDTWGVWGPQPLFLADACSVCSCPPWCGQLLLTMNSGWE